MLMSVITQEKERIFAHVIVMRTAAIQLVHTHADVVMGFMEMAWTVKVLKSLYRKHCLII